MKELLKKYANYITGALAVSIILSGISLANGVDKWWLPAVILMGATLLLIVFIREATIVKIILYIILVLNIAAFSFQLGIIISLNIGMLFSGLSLVLFTLSIALSYIRISGNSRWTTAFIGTLTYSILALEMLTLGATRMGVNSGWLYVAIIVPFFVGLIVFLLTYFVFNRTTTKYMPKPNMDIKEVEQFVEPLKDNWNIVVDGSVNKEHILIWNKNYAYSLVPLEFHSKLHEKGKRTVKPAYQGHKLNPFMLHLIINDVPFWKSAGADVTVVMLDTTNMNGDKPILLGAKLPDTKKEIPVLLMPGKQYYKNPQKLMDGIESKLSEYKRKLTPKQLTMLDGIDNYKSEDSEDTENDSAGNSEKTELGPAK